MVQVDCRSEVPRYWLLEPVRQYAATKLMASGDDTETRDRHCAWCLGLIERAEPALSGHDQLVWLDLLEQEHDNLRAAVTRSLATAPEIAMRMIAALWEFCERRSHYAEWAGWSRQIWPSSIETEPRSEPWVRVLLGASRFAFRTGGSCSGQSPR